MNKRVVFGCLLGVAHGEHSVHLAADVLHDHDAFRLANGED